jgi:hypothetical protein
MYDYTSRKVTRMTLLALVSSKVASMITTHVLLFLIAHQLKSLKYEKENCWVSC